MEPVCKNTIEDVLIPNLLCGHRDPSSNKIRNPYNDDDSTSFWTAGTRVVISEEGDFAFGRCGRIIESRLQASYATGHLIIA